MLTIDELVAHIREAKSLTSRLGSIIMALSDQRERIEAGQTVTPQEAIEVLRAVAVSRLKRGVSITYYHPEHGRVIAEPYNGGWRMRTERYETPVSLEYVLQDIGQATMIAAEVA